MMPVVRPNSRGRFPALDNPFIGDIALGNGTQWMFMIALFDEKLSVFIRGWGHAVLPDASVQPEALMTALHASNPPRYHRILMGDAGNVADLLNDQLGYGNDVPRRGHYYPDLTEKWEAGTNDETA